MQAIGLHELRIQGDAVQEKRYQGYFQLARKINIDRVKLFGIGTAIIGRQMHADQHHARAAGVHGFNHGREIILHRREREAA